MDGGHHFPGQGVWKEQPAILEKLVLRAYEGASRSSAQANDDLRADLCQFGLQPWETRVDLARRRFLVDAALAPFFELKVLDGIRQVKIGAIQIGIVEGPVEQTSRRSHERLTGQVFFIAGLFSDQEGARPRRSRAQHRLRRVTKKIAALAALHRIAEYAQ
jgi:hypothetical protein